jgi:hypothetical protein
MFYALDIIGITNEGQGLIIKEALDLTFSELLPDTNEMYDVEVYITEETGDALGLVCDEEDNAFTILLNKDLLNDDVELFKTVCHEAVHITQYIKTDLIHLPYNKFAWKGSIIESMEYNKRPWEIEAYNFEEKAEWHFVNNHQ